MAGRLLGLREKASKPEDITIENLSDNLNFDSDYLCRYEIEKEQQKVILEEKDELIQQLTISGNASQKALQEAQQIVEANKTKIVNQNAIIAEQKAKIDEKDRVVFEELGQDDFILENEFIEKLKNKGFYNKKRKI